MSIDIQFEVSIPTGSIKIAFCTIGIKVKADVSIPTGSIKIFRQRRDKAQKQSFNSNWFD